MHLVKPYFVYDRDRSVYYPGQPLVNNSTGADTLVVERHDQTAADGTRYSYYVGDRDAIDLWLDGLDETAKTNFGTFWDGVKDGSEFSLVFDDSVRKCGTGSCGDGYLVGDDSDGDAVVTIPAVMDGVEQPIQPHEVEGYYSVQFRVRRVTT